MTGDDCGLGDGSKCEARGDGVVPYGRALLKLYAGSMKNPLFGFLVVGHEIGLRAELGDDAAELALDATSYSARRQASEQ